MLVKFLHRTLLALVAVHAVLAASSSYETPSKNGGSMLTKQKEPLNVIISGTSDEYVLSEKGFVDFGQAIGYDPDSFVGKVQGNGKQSANLGDGRGSTEQAGLMRQHPGSVEAIVGGNHFRYWMQVGDKANTKAVFIAASVEKALKYHHDLVSNGYDQGRDMIVKNATSQPRSWNGKKFTTKQIKMDKSLLKGVSKNDLNHNIGTDGGVAILEVSVSDDTEADKGDNDGTCLTTPASSLMLLAVIFICLSFL